MLMHLVSSMFDANRNMDDYMEVQLWKMCHSNLMHICNELEAHPKLTLTTTAHPRVMSTTTARPRVTGTTTARPRPTRTTMGTRSNASNRSSSAPAAASSWATPR